MMILISLFLLGATSCQTHVKLIDVEACGDKGSLGAHCKSDLSGKTRDIPKEAWDQARFGQICFTSAGVENRLTALETLCQQTKRCDYEQVHQSVETIRAVIKTVSDTEQH
jgi:hypothetical protein